MTSPIAHYGTFDVANYGDLLFPLLLERRIGDLAPLIHVSPVGGAPPIAGGVASIAPEQVPAALVGVVVGGGHLIHAAPAALPAYREPPDRALRAYPSLWLGAAERALASRAPLVWNAPGVPAAFAPRAAAVVAWATDFVDYLAVRDARSAGLLRLAGCAQDPAVVPDTALELPSLFPPARLARVYAEAFAVRDQPRRGPTLAIHANARYLHEEVPLVAARIDRICARAGVQPILLALGACHGDDALARALAAHLATPALLVDRPRSLEELAACIACSVAYLGSSLHGFITACAYGVKGALVARESGDGGKFSGFLERFGLAAWLLRDWGAAEERFAALWSADASPWRAVAPTAQPALERHGASLRGALTAPPVHSARRAEAPQRIARRIAAEQREFGIHAALLAHQAELTLDQMDRLERQREQTAALKASYRTAAAALRGRLAQLEQDRATDALDSSTRDDDASASR